MPHINVIGIDGSGKDTVFKKLIGDFPNAVQLKEPGGTPEADRIRDVLLSATYEIQERLDLIQSLLLQDHVTDVCKSYLKKASFEMKVNGLNALSEAYLFAASRSQTNEKLVLPALKENKLVLGRRSIACSMSYQGNARNIGMERIWAINEKARFISLPDFEILFDLPVETAASRLKRRTEKKDRLDQETLDFHRKSREGYLAYYQTFCPYPYQIIAADQDVEAVYQDAKKAIVSFLSNQHI
jgi:dTMP kinase